MNKKYFNKYTIISFIFLIIFIIILKDVLMYEEISYDKWANNIFDGLRNNKMTLFMTIISGFGCFTFITSSIILLFLLYKNKKTVYYIFTSTLGIFLINDFVKHIIHRSRPIGSLVHEASYSFPSSHSMISIVFYGLLIYLIYKNIKNIKFKWSLITLLVLLIILICISRIYLGVHYLSDIVGGISLSIIYLMIFLMINKNFEKKV